MMKSMNQDKKTTESGTGESNMDPIKTSKELGSVVPAVVSRDTG